MLNYIKEILKINTLYKNKTNKVKFSDFIKESNNKTFNKLLNWLKRD